MSMELETPPRCPMCHYWMGKCCQGQAQRVTSVSQGGECRHFITAAAFANRALDVMQCWP